MRNATMRSSLVTLMLVTGVSGAGYAQTAGSIADAAAARAALLLEAPPPARPTVRVESSNSHGAVIGFVVGAPVGVAAGYGVFNGFCEAVDNRCEGSRPLWMAVGGLALGGVGALVGILID